MNYRILYCTAIFLFFSCNDDDSIEAPNPPAPGDKILLVGNEGAFSGTSASITTINLSTQEVQQNAFALANDDAILGSILQSIYQYNDAYYLVVNNSQKIEVVNAQDLSKQRIISIADGSPRYISIFESDQAYVSDLFGGGLHLVDPIAGTYSGFLATQINTEHLLQVGEELWFTEPFGTHIGFVNTSTNEFIDDLVLSSNPSGFARDAEGDVWVFCGGDAFSNPTVAPKLFEVDSDSKEILRSIEVDSDPGYISTGIAISPDQDKIYFLSGGIYEVDITGMDLNPELFYEAPSRTLYTLFVDQNTGMIGCTDVKDYVQNGDVLLFNSDGTDAGVYNVGIIPNALFWVDN